MRRQASRQRGFTLIELLVVIAIIAALVALIIPAVQRARESARRSECQNRLKQIGIALENYHSAFTLYPPGWIGVDPATKQTSVLGESGFGWAAMILPYMEQDSLNKKLDFNKAIDDTANQVAMENTIVTFRCPSDSSDDRWPLYDEANPTTKLVDMPTSNYVACFGTGNVNTLEDCESKALNDPCYSDGVFYHNSKTRVRMMFDGPSQTFLAGERVTNIDPPAALSPPDQWYSTWVGVYPNGQEALARIVGVVDHPPNHEDAHLEDFSSAHPGGVHMLLGDGRVKFINENINPSVYQGLATIQGKEVVGEF